MRNKTISKWWKRHIPITPVAICRNTEDCQVRGRLRFFSKEKIICIFIFIFIFNNIISYSGYTGSKFNWLFRVVNWILNKRIFFVFEHGIHICNFYFPFNWCPHLCFINHIWTVACFVCIVFSCSSFILSSAYGATQISIADWYCIC